MWRKERIFSQADLSGFSLEARQRLRCLYIRGHCEERSKHAAPEIARLLREMEGPVDVGTCQAIAHFIEPVAQSLRTGPKSNVFDDWEKAMEASTIYGQILSRIGQAGGPKNVTEAKGEACNVLGCSERTLEKYTGGPMRSIVESAQQGTPLWDVNFEQLTAVCTSFLIQNIKK